MRPPAMPTRLTDTTRAALLGLLVAAGAAAAQPGSGDTIFTCVDARGRKLTADRPIVECMDREQRVLNRDGTLRRILSPSLTADERAAKEEVERKAGAEKAARSEAARRDRNLLLRYPNEAAHAKARAAALQQVRASLRLSELRTAELTRERKPLLDEAEFYKGRAVPLSLKQRLDANDAAAQAQRELVTTQQAESARLNEFYDRELQRLRKLWAGAAPGSLGEPEPEAPPALRRRPASASAAR